MIDKYLKLIQEKIAYYEQCKQRCHDEANIMMAMAYTKQIVGLQEAMEIIMNVEIDELNKSTK